jgi:hypothetical protein
MLRISISILLLFSVTHAQIEETMKEKLAQFVVTDISYNQKLLDDKQKQVVENLYYASKIIDKIFLKQVYSKNEVLYNELQNAEMPGSDLVLQYFEIMFGPFDRLDRQKPFYGRDNRPSGADFYPEDLTKDEFNTWLETHPADKETFTSGFTVIRRRGNQLVAIPYSEYYKSDLELAAQYLKIAAGFAENASLKKYLETRADAFLSNDYYQSDIAWMDLKDHTIEVVIGPYEVYEDELFNYKASFESFITLVDPVESAKLAQFAALLDEIERNLPIPDQYKNFERGSESPMVVVEAVFCAGDTKAGVQTLAFNLPNDERVRKAKGSKKVMLKNIHEAKFNKLLYPIAENVLDQTQLDDVTFDAFFNHTLMHEISHGVGPGFITVNGRETEVKKELKETYSKLEECKADVLGMYNNKLMIEKGIYPASFEKHLYTTFLAGIFRSIRFGIDAAHGAGNAIIYNYLLENGAYKFDKDAVRVRVNFDRIEVTVTELATILLTIQAEGDYKGALTLINKYAVDSPSIKAIRAKLQALPVDIKPVFQIEEEFSAVQ